jgi:hypothetical protein
VPFEREQVPFEREQVPFEREQVPFEREQVPFEREQVPFERRRMVIWRSQTGGGPPETGGRPALLGGRDPNSHFVVRGDETGARESHAPHTGSAGRPGGRQVQLGGRIRDGEQVGHAIEVIVGGGVLGVHGERGAFSLEGGGKRPVRILESVQNQEAARAVGVDEVGCGH